MSKGTYPLTVNLVTWNGARWLPFCLESLRRSIEQNFFLMVIDNASFDGSADLVEEFLTRHPELKTRSRLVRNRVNVGFARAHNQALAWAQSEFALVLNQDVLLSPSYLGELSRCLTQDDRAAAATGKLLRWSFDPATFYLGVEEQGTQALDSTGLVVLRTRRVLNDHEGEPNRTDVEIPRRIFGVPATAALYRRAALLAVSPSGEVFDEDFVTYKEDVDLAWRLAYAGYDAWYLPQATAYHDRSLGSSGTLRGEIRERRNRHRGHKVYSYANHLAVLVKNEAATNFIRDFPWILAHEVAKATYLLLTDPATLVRGIVRALKLTPAMLKKRRLLKPTRRRAPTELRQWWTREKAS